MQNILIQGNPGTGKTFVARAMAYYMCCKNLDVGAVAGQDYDSDRVSIEAFINSAHCEFIQVYPSMRYEDIVSGVEIRAAGTMHVAYAEKRVKQLCDRAIAGKGKYCIILDDITRTNPDALLGNLLYPMAYRNQAVELPVCGEIIIPDNVLMILTGCPHMSGNAWSYALLRCINCMIALDSDRRILDTYYTNAMQPAAKDLILQIFDDIQGFVTRNFIPDATAQAKDYLPGHGLFMIERRGTGALMLDQFKQKMLYQVYPYLTELQMNGVIGGDLKNLFDGILAAIHTGESAWNRICNVEKIFLNSNLPVPAFTLRDTRDYFVHTIADGGGREHRSVMECVLDAILLNGIISPDEAWSALLRNTKIGRIESETDSIAPAAYLARRSEAERYNYITPRAERRVSHSFYSVNAIKGGRWGAQNDSVAYRVSFRDGSAQELYVPLNGFRCHNYTISAPNIMNTQHNAAEIFKAVYPFIEAYLRLYDAGVSMVMAHCVQCQELQKLIGLERKYWEAVHAGIRECRGDSPRQSFFVKKIKELRTLWFAAGDEIALDKNKFHALVSGAARFSIAAYEDLFRCTAATEKRIKLQEVEKMVDLKDYQQIMDNIGIRQMIFQGPPGTSKTFESKCFVLKQLAPDAPTFAAPILTQEQISNDMLPYKLTAEDYANPAASPKLASGGWDLVQFHPSYGYEDFIRGIDVKAVDGVPSYESANRILGKMAEFAQLAANGADGGTVPKFYLIVDEINRANLATVFGELIYGLEYRNSRVSTPYEVADRVVGHGATTRDILLCKNFYLIGTMNTADKSTDALDYAIRRRFLFIDSPPKREVVLSCYQNVSGKEDEKSIELRLFDATQALFHDEQYFNSEYQVNDVKIGHSYFLRDRKVGYEDVIIEHFIFQVIPILREYAKDGILDAGSAALLAAESSPEEIKLAATPEEQIARLSANIMLYVKEYGNKNKSGQVMDNRYIGEFIEALRLAFDE